MNVPAVLTGRAGAEGVRRFLEEELAAAAGARLERLLEPGAALRDCRIHRVKLKPDRKLSAWCVAFVRDRRGNLQARHIAVTWSRTDSALPARTDLLEEEACRRGLATPFRSLVSEVPGPRMRILVAPLDPGMPALVRMSDGAFAGDAIGLGAAPAAVATIRYRPGERHVLSYAGPAEAWYAKLYRPGATAQAYRRASSVYAAVSGGPARFRASPPLLCLSEDALVTPAVRGRPAAPRGADLEIAGSLLRLIHSGVPPSGPAATLAGEIAGVERAAEHIDALLPAAARSLRRTLTAAREADDRTGPQSAVLVHGDFKLDHLFWDDASVTVIDLDRAGPAEPALDLGKMLADLRWRRGTADSPGGDTPGERLLRGYGHIGAHCLARARLYEAVLLLKAAARRGRLLDPAWERVVGAAVREAEALVDAGRAPAPARRAGGVPA